LVAVAFALALKDTQLFRLMRRCLHPPVHPFGTVPHFDHFFFFHFSPPLKVQLRKAGLRIRRIGSPTDNIQLFHSASASLLANLITPLRCILTVLGLTIHLGFFIGF